MKTAPKQSSGVIAILTDGRVVPVSQLNQERVAAIDTELRKTQQKLDESRTLFDENETMIEELTKKREELSMSIFNLEQDIRLLEDRKRWLNG